MEGLFRARLRCNQSPGTFSDLHESDLVLVRRLPPFHANIRKRLVKLPRVYVRDSGIVHTL